MVIAEVTKSLKLDPKKFTLPISFSHRQHLERKF